MKTFYKWEEFILSFIRISRSELSECRPCSLCVRDEFNKKAVQTCAGRGVIDAVDLPEGTSWITIDADGVPDGESSDIIVDHIEMGVIDVEA